MRERSGVRAILIVTVLAVALASVAVASSHREAPAILSSPQVDGTDFYMFRSYEAGRDGFVTLIANYNPLQDPYGGPNYFPLDPDASYDIHINNDGDITEDLTFRFNFRQRLNPFILPVGGENVAVPLVNIGPFGPPFGTGALSEFRTYTVRLIRGGVDGPGRTVDFVTRAGSGRPLFGMPFDNIGKKSSPNYAVYASRFIYDIDIPGCDTPGRVFAGQRKESFAVNLGEVFDLINTNPVGPPDGEPSDLEDKNITSLALEVPIDCLTDESSIIGGWTTARRPRFRTLLKNPTFDHADDEFGALQQVSRLANPLVNEVAIGLPDKNLFNASHPRDDGQFLTYVTNPTLPELIEILFAVPAPNQFPRQDLVEVFLTGIPNLNVDGTVGEVMRLNTAFPPVPAASQNNLGIIGTPQDLAGYPNGRRPGDDVVDISLQVMMQTFGITDGALQNALQFDEVFPYLRTPIPGSPN